MKYRVGYFLRANDDVYRVVRDHLPEDCGLLTLPRASTPSLSESEAVGDLDFLIAVRVTAEMISRADRLKLIQLPGVGYDQVDLETAAKRGIPVAMALSGSEEAVAEHAMMLMLAVSRRLVELSNSVRAGQWLMWDRRVVSRSLHGQTLGLIGMGRIGTAVAHRAAAFQMKVQYWDPVRADSFPRVSLDELIETSDIVSLHVPMTPQTHRLLNAARIRRMKRGAVLINTARGGIVDETALFEALMERRLAGAGLDVFESEPPDPNNPLLVLDQVVLTPHVATGTLDCLEVKARAYSENIQRVLNGQEPVGLLQFLPLDSHQPVSGQASACQSRGESA